MQQCDVHDHHMPALLPLLLGHLQHLPDNGLPHDDEHQ
jgi:hypothetical protein